MITMGVNRVDLSTGETLIDLTGDTVTPETMIKGVTAHNSAGEPIEGEFDPDIYQTKEDGNLKTPESTIVDAINGLNNDRDILMAWYDENHYVKMTGSFTATNSGGTYEIGSSITSTFTWSFSKLPTTLTVGGVSKTPTQTGTTASQTFTASSQTSRTFTIKGVYAGVYGNEPVEKTWTYNFQNKRYWGMAEKPTTINGAFIKGLSNNEFATSRSKSFNLKDSSPNKYIWYCYPTRFNLASFTSNGFKGGFDYIGEVEVENSKGVKEYYYVYRSTEKGVGTADIVVS